MKIADFFVALGFEADQKSLDDFNGGLENLDKTLKGLKMVAVAFAIQQFTSSTVNATVAVQNFTNQTGLMQQQLRQFQIGAELADISLGADQVASSITALQNNLEQISLGGGNVTPFQLLGINTAGKGAFDVLEDVRQAIQGMSNARATNLIQMMGLSPQFINVLRLTRKEFEALFENRVFLSREQEKRVIDMGTAFTSMVQALVSLKDQIVAFVAPALTKLAGSFEWIMTGLAGFVKHFEHGEKAVKAFGVSIGILLARVFPVTTIIGGLVLIIDDLVTGLKGGDSIAGRFINKVKEIGKALFDYMEKPLDKVVTMFEKIVGYITDIKEKAVGLFDFNLGGQGVLDSLTSGVSSVANSVQNTFENVFNINSNADAGSVAESIQSLQQNEFNKALNNFNNGVSN